MDADNDLPLTQLDETGEKELAALNARRTRYFVRFAGVEGGVLAVLVVLIFVVEVISQDIGVWLLLAVAVIGGTMLSASLVGMAKEQAALIAASEKRTGENPASSEKAAGLA